MPVKAKFLIVFCLLSCVQACFAKDIEVKIGLFDSSNRNYFRANKNYKIYALTPSGNIDNTLMQKKAKSFTLVRFATATNDKLIIASEPDLASSSKPLLLSCDEKEIDSDCIWMVMKSKFDKQAKRYRGAILIQPNSNDFTVINKIKLEDYLRGVVPSEMPSSWHKEALKAQSVAARTYTISKLNRRKSLGYDLKATVEDQVYLGYSNEKESTNKALEDTQGMVLLDKQKRPIEAYFYSQAGFSTASAADIWGLEHAVYLRPKIMADNSKFWQKHFTSSQINKKLADLKLKTIKSLTILNTSPDGRARDVLVSDGTRHIKLSGEELRHKLGLRSTFFDTQMNKGTISFVGKGFGHGIGMSQYGAKKLAQQGKSFKYILEYFYPGSKLETI